jgi:hypothetical protein
MTLLLDLCYLPPVQYMAHWVNAKGVLLDTDSPYLKGTWRNRTQIATAGGPLYLSIPLLSGKYLQPYHEVRIAYHEPWQKIHWRSIHDAYRKSPFFEHYADELEAYYRQRTERLVDWNQGLMAMLLRWMQLSSETAAPEAVTDMRKRLGLKPGKNEADLQFQPIPYVQVFQDRLGFLPNLSVLDLLCCTGPQARYILQQSIICRE